ncbi:MAG: hypothetical protein ACRC78_26385, partial [Planktothrix sp.]
FDLDNSWWVKFNPLEKARSWLGQLLIFGEQLSEPKRNDLLKLGEFLINHPELSFKESLKEYLKILEDEDIELK